MYILMMSVSFTLVVSVLVMLMASLLTKKIEIDREKSSRFEFGFDPKGSARLPYSLLFFLVAEIYLIFDMEITLLMPLAFILTLSNIFTWLCAGLSFLLILLVGLYYDWSKGALEWSE